MKHKISVIGAGNVGAATAQYIAEDNLANVVLLDIVEGIPQGKSLDLIEAGPLRGFKNSIKGTNDYKETTDSDIVIITAGLARKPGMSRDDLLAKNAQIIKSVVQSVVKYSPNCIILMVTNPLDVTTYLAMRTSQFSPERVIGMAGVLDSARMSAFVAMELNIDPSKIEALVMGGHGDSMLPLPQYCKANGKEISKLLPKDKLDAIIERTRKAGGEIVAHLKTGSAYYSTAAAVVKMADSIINDKKETLPCSVYANGEYGLNDLYIGLPAVLGKNGAEKIVNISLSKEENTALQKSAEEIKANISKLNI